MIAKHSFISVSIIWSERNVDVPKHVERIYPKLTKNELVNKFYLLFRRNAKNSYGRSSQAIFVGDNG